MTCALRLVQVAFGSRETPLDEEDYDTGLGKVPAQMARMKLGVWNFHEWGPWMATDQMASFHPGYMCLAPWLPN